MHRPEEAVDADAADWRHVGDRIERNALAQRWQRGNLCGCAEEHRIAIGGRFDQLLAGHDAISTGPVVDDHRLAKRLQHRGRNDTCDHVGRAARAECNDCAERLGRELCLYGQRAGQQHGEE